MTGARSPERLVRSACSPLAWPVVGRGWRGLSSLFGAVLLLGAAAAPASPVISEFLASSTSAYPDEDGEFPDWIELHNPDATPVDLGGYFLTDNRCRLRDGCL